MRGEVFAQGNEDLVVTRVMGLTLSIELTAEALARITVHGEDGQVCVMEAGLAE